MLATIELGLPQSWLPDETLFSLCSRYHRASGQRLASTTCRLLFGHPNQGCAHDFPARLNHFLAVSGNTLGSVEHIVEHRTVLPLYLRFASTNQVNATLNAAALNSSGRLKFQLGLLTSRFRANHPLKACPYCMDEDMKAHSTPYWHREHQLPGVWVCLRHGRKLETSNLKATGVSRFHWVLPSPSQFTDPAEPTAIADSTVRLARMVADLVGRSDVRLSTPMLGAAFRTALAQKGFLTGPKQRLKHAAAGDAYVAFLAPLLNLEQMDGLPSSADEACAEIARQIASERSGVHPLRRLTLAAWLFDNLDQLLACVDQATAPKALEVTKDAREAPSPVDPRRAQFFKVLASGLSTSAASREAGIDTTTGMVWAASAGLSTPRRPKTLKGNDRTQLIKLLRQGLPKADAATYSKVSIQTVTTLLRTEVGLHEAWRLAGFENARLRYRRTWQRFIAINPLSGVKAARMAEPATYAWLYRNDRDWLSERTGDMAKEARRPQSRVDWDTRDRELADLVRVTALSLVEVERVRRIKLHHLYQRIPELKAKLNTLDRLPLTRAVIFDVVGPRTGL
ncbi:MULTISPECIES: TnsD family Tn7-like transposition protein [Acidovorax]|nr:MULTISPECIES: TnsD family Tn7-like transposition protein [Acidovorax]RMA56318.1 TniQ protein [Acidovorax sp. 100]